MSDRPPPRLETTQRKSKMTLPHPIATPRRPSGAALLLVTAALAILAALPALAADPARVSADPKTRYARESAACSRIAEHGARANCLSEASTRLAATQPTQPGESTELLRQNAIKRCEALPELERKDCLLRMQGQGTVSGSVEGGGLYRELVTREAGLPAAASAPLRAASTP